MNGDKRVCPMMVNQMSAYCIKEMCAWWLNACEACAVNVTALTVLAENNRVRLHVGGIDKMIEEKRNENY